MSTITRILIALVVAALSGGFTFYALIPYQMIATKPPQLPAPEEPSEPQAVIEGTSIMWSHVVAGGEYCFGAHLDGQGKIVLERCERGGTGK